MSEQKVCTKETPCVKGDGNRWAHPDANSTGDSNDGIDEYDHFHCPVCGIDFKVTVAQ